MSSRSQLWTPEVHLYGTRKQKEKHGLHLYDRLHMRRSVLAMAKSCRKKKLNPIADCRQTEIGFSFQLTCIHLSSTLLPLRFIAL